MLTNECWLGYHDNCDYFSSCDCLCHYEFSWDDADENDDVKMQDWLKRPMTQDVLGTEKDRWYLQP